MDELKLYYVNYFSHDPIKHIYVNHAGYIFAENENRIMELLREAHACNYKYGEMCLKEDCPFLGHSCDCQCTYYVAVGIRSIQKVDIYEGKILYGERWREIG